MNLNLRVLTVSQGVFFAPANQTLDVFTRFLHFDSMDLIVCYQSYDHSKLTELHHQNVCGMGTIEEMEAHVAFHTLAGDQIGFTTGTMTFFNKELHQWDDYSWSIKWHYPGVVQWFFDYLKKIKQFKLTGEENEMRVSDAYRSGYLKATDLGGAERVVTIEKVKPEFIGDRDKYVLFFKGQKKGLVLNGTNAKQIAKILGSDEMESWAGSQIMLYSTEVNFKGQMVDAIRVKAKAPARPVAPVVDEEEDWNSQF